VASNAQSVIQLRAVAALLNGRAERLPLGVDPGADRGDDGDNRNHQDAEQNSVFHQRSAFLVGGKALNCIQSIRHLTLS
jgi:hypothetical protein